MKTIVFATVLMSTVAAGMLFAAASHADDDDSGSVACLSGPAGVKVKGDGNLADGVIYDATKGKSSAKSDCAPSMAMGETDDDDGNEDGDED